LYYNIIKIEITAIMLINQSILIKYKETMSRISKSQQILIFRLLLNSGSQKSIRMEEEKREIEREREKERKRHASSNPIYEAN